MSSVISADFRVEHSTAASLCMNMWFCFNENKKYDLTPKQNNWWQKSRMIQSQLEKSRFLDKIEPKAIIFIGYQKSVQSSI